MTTYFAYFMDEFPYMVNTVYYEPSDGTGVAYNIENFDINYVKNNRCNIITIFDKKIGDL